MSDNQKQNPNQNQNPIQEESAADYGLNPEKFAIVDRPPIVPATAAIPAPPSPLAKGPNPYIRSVAPTSVQLETDLADTTLKGVPVWRVMPQAPSSSSGIIAAAQTAAQSVVEEASVLLETNSTPNSDQGTLNLIAGPNIELTAGTGGAVTVTGTSGGDGLTHGTTPWEIDPSFVSRRDDFQWNSYPSSSSYFGETNWYLLGYNNANFGAGPLQSGGAGHVGVLPLWNSSSGANTGGWFWWATAWNGSDYAPNLVLPLFDYAGWGATFVFKWQRAAWENNATDYAFSMAHLSTYLGFGNAMSWSDELIGGRPPIFLGLRYDTDPGVSLAITSVANASAGTTVYTGTITDGGSNAFAGNYFTTTNCGNAANEGTFLCVASTTTTLTLVNASGVAATGLSGTAANSAISDTTFHFEYVANPCTGSASEPRNNTQGQTYNTGVTPTEGVWYRLDMNSSTPGTVNMILSAKGSQLATWSVTASPVEWGTTTASSGSIQYGNNLILAGPATTFNGTNMCYYPFGIGSNVTLGGTLPTGLSGTVSLIDTYAGPTNCNFSWPSSVSGGNYGFTLTGYPALLPWFSLFNDTAGGPTYGEQRSFYFDFFGFWYDAGNAGASVNSGYSRYFPGS